MNKSHWRLFAAGLLIGTLSLAIPLLRDFHWESAGLASLVSAFTAGTLSARGRWRTARLFRNIASLLIGWVLPLLIYALSTGCFSLDGLGFWLLGPVPSMLFGAAVGRTVRLSGIRFPALLSTLILLGCALVPVVYQLLSYPQLYIFNHVWSYWPGPIYDELVPLDHRLFIYRGITLLWVVALWALPAMMSSIRYRSVVLFSAIALLFCYLNLANWGLIAPEERLIRELGSIHQTEHFTIVYDGAALDPMQIEQIARQHEHHLEEITGALEVDREVYRENRIHSYIYAHASQKKRLTGAGQTSYVPVWLSDQTHIALEHLNRVLRHELVHVVARQFGNRFGASMSIGLVEGLAVALDPDRHNHTTHQLVAASEEWPEARELAQLFAPAGFYSSSGAVSYLVSGSFVSHLLAHYPVDLFKTAYRTGDLEHAYSPLDLEELTRSWHRRLEQTEVDDDIRRRSVTLFQTPSLFEKPCPRVTAKRQMAERYAESTATDHSCDQTLLSRSISAIR